MPWEGSIKLRMMASAPGKNPTLADKVESPAYRMGQLVPGDGELAIDT